jgi:hypothetical protein
MTYEGLPYEELADKSNPIVAYTTQMQLDLAKNTEDYLVTAFHKVGINPNVVIEQNAFITELKEQLRIVLEIIKTDDVVNFFGDKAIFNSGRNSMRDEIRQALGSNYE